MDSLRVGLAWILRRYRVRLALRFACRALEIARLAAVRPTHRHRFWIVSSSRNAGDAALRCLKSVDRQRYDRDLMTHVFIDDASCDGTPDLLRTWLAAHPNHRVQLICRRQRLGGTVNNLDGFRVAPPGSVVVELNGDDWLPDAGVVAFLNTVYQDPGVWMTYNTFRRSDGVVPIALPPPRRVRHDHSYRSASWATSHLHTFRSELFRKVPQEALIDPVTGAPWEKADDLALYFAMLEMAGDHARPIYRVTSIYNSHAQTEENLDAAGQGALANRIRACPRLKALAELQLEDEPLPS